MYNILKHQCAKLGTWYQVSNNQSVELTSQRQLTYLKERCTVDRGTQANNGTIKDGGYRYTGNYQYLVAHFDGTRHLENFR